MKDSSQLLELYPKFTCTMSDNRDAIQRALHRCFLSAVLGNFLFHLQQTIKKKRTLWNVQVLLTVPVNAMSKSTIRRRDENESFARDAVNWFPSLQHVYEFNLCFEIFLSYLESRKDIQFSNILRRERTLQTEKTAGPGV
jgi:hypothetical protein